MSAGEVSGDTAGAGLAEAIRARRPDVSIFGIGGSRMAGAGVEIDCVTNHLGAVGVSEALGTLPTLWGILETVRDRIRKTPPDVAVLIGNDVFSVFLARRLRARGIPTVSFFPPQSWIWGSLAGITARSFDLILTCFSHEQEVYAAAGRRSGTEVAFVGHYLAQALTPRTPESTTAARRSLGLDDRTRVIGLLPGSRTHEVKNLCPLLLEAAGRLLDHRPGARFLIPVVDSDLGERIRSEIEKRSLTESVIIVDDSRTVMEAADLLLLASGTASFEAALLGVPMVIVYRVSVVTNTIVKTAIRLGLIEDDTVGLPNLILGHRVVPEFIQRKATADRLFQEAQALLDEPSRTTEMRNSLSEVARKVSCGDSLAMAADAVINLAKTGGRRRTQRRAAAGSGN
jgi:lipid-A-disaccharide synthase